MNKFLASTFAAVTLLAATQVQAYDSTGCGLGSLAFRGQSGPLAQILAVTTNGFFGIQTFGITSGTSGCDPNGRITGGTGKVLFTFLENNMEQYAFDASRGEGETIQTIAGILNIPAEKVAQVSKENFNTIFPNENTDVLTVALNLTTLLDVQV